MDLINKVALITGGASGIGKTISLELAKRGATVVINYNNSESACNQLVKDIEKNGGKAIGIKANVSNYEEAQQLIETIMMEFKKINIVVNNAGVTDDALILRMKESQFDRVLDVNLKGMWNVCKHAAKPLMKSGYGRVVNISSISGILGNAGQSNYSASKAGVIGLSKALSREFSARGVTVNVVAPGFIETKMTENLSADLKDMVKKQIPLKRFGTTKDIAYAVCFLASEQAAYVTGQTLVVDGGLAM